MKKQTECKRCGTCCRQGGPALHEEDRKLLADKLVLTDFVTIRKNELVYSPLSGKIEQAEKEFLKISGQGKSWACKFYDSRESSCTIHARRPLECRQLKCWDTNDIKKIIYRNLLNRFDLIAQKETIVPHLKEHENECPWQQVNTCLQALSSTGHETDQLRELDVFIRKDMAIRGRAIEIFGLTVDQELFYFGRPIFQIIEAMKRNSFIYK